MAEIRKARETMTARARVLKTFAHEKTDRVPIGYASNPTVHAKVSEALGIPVADRQAFLQAIGADIRGVGAEYIGPPLFPEIPGCEVNEVYGHYTRWIENEHGGYHDYCHFPLAGADEETMAAFRYPSPDDFNYDAALARIGSLGDYAIHAGGAGTGDIINSLGMIMGMEDALVGLCAGDEAVLALADRKLDMQIGVLERLLDKAKGRIDFLWLGEDLGTQRTPMISKELYRGVLRPRHQRFVDLAKSYGLPVMIHTCGSSSWVYEDFIDMGIRAVDSLQPEAVNMSPEYLLRNFGGRLAFQGLISTAGPLAYGTAAETTAYCRDTLGVMMAGGGYFFAPSHMIQDNSPPENVLAMYQAAHGYGRYE
jgi:uroporphyrinogen decarboxylase